MKEEAEKKDSDSIVPYLGRLLRHHDDQIHFLFEQDYWKFQTGKKETELGLVGSIHAMKIFSLVKKLPRERIHFVDIRLFDGADRLVEILYYNNYARNTFNKSGLTYYNDFDVKIFLHHLKEEVETPANLLEIENAKKDAGKNNKHLATSLALARKQIESLPEGSQWRFVLTEQLNGPEKWFRESYPFGIERLFNETKEILDLYLFPQKEGADVVSFSWEYWSKETLTWLDEFRDKQVRLMDLYTMALVLTYKNSVFFGGAHHAENLQSMLSLFSWKEVWNDSSLDRDQKWISVPEIGVWETWLK